MGSYLGLTYIYIYIYICIASSLFECCEANKRNQQCLASATWAGPSECMFSLSSVYAAYFAPTPYGTAPYHSVAWGTLQNVSKTHGCVLE